MKRTFGQKIKYFFTEYLRKNWSSILFAALAAAITVVSLAYAGNLV
ncbi:MAG: hypothetical protein NC350_04665 [Corallococcus sp.]|nr:hypothetical protein [Corallococcus sp.]